MRTPRDLSLMADAIRLLEKISDQSDNPMKLNQDLIRIYQQIEDSMIDELLGLDDDKS